MKRIGECKCGCVIVVMNQAELKQMQQFAADLGEIGAVAPVTVDAPPPYVTPKRIAALVEESKKRAAKKPAKSSGRMCAICGSPTINNRVTCAAPATCFREYQRRGRIASHARLTVRQPGKATATPASNPPAQPVDSHAAIRAALERADAKLAKG